MASMSPIRDPAKDALLTPQNCASDHRLPADAGGFDRQYGQARASRQRRCCRQTVELNKLPMVMASVNVETGVNQPTIHQLLEVLGDVSVINRTSIMGTNNGSGSNRVRRRSCWCSIFRMAPSRRTWS